MTIREQIELKEQELAELMASTLKNIWEECKMNNEKAYGFDKAIAYIDEEIEKLNARKKETQDRMNKVKERNKAKERDYQIIAEAVESFNKEYNENLIIGTLRII